MTSGSSNTLIAGPAFMAVAFRRAPAIKWAFGARGAEIKVRKLRDPAAEFWSAQCDTGIHAGCGF
jgi:hypothetical protein